MRELWYFEGGELLHGRERIMPGTTLQLLVNLHEDELRAWHGPAFAAAQRTRGAAVSGLYLQPFAIDTHGQRRVVGAVFRPGAAAVVLGVPSDALAGAHTELEALWSAGAATLRERLLEAQSPARVLALLDALLVERISGELDPIVTAACRELERGARVAAVADHVGLGRKRLGERFSAAVGVSPKAYARLARLQRVLGAAAGPKRLDWAQLAVLCGYYDQAHLIQEFRELSGVTPAHYRPRAAGELNHMVLAP